MASLVHLDVPPVRLRRVVTPPAAAWAPLWIAAVAGVALALRPTLFQREAPIEGVEVVLALVGGSFAACGLIAWRRRPDSRVGMLMTATGFLFYVRPLLLPIGWEPAPTLLMLLVDVWIYTFVALLLTFLSGGRLETRLDRLLVLSYAVPLVAGQALWMLFDPVDGHLLLAWPNADVAWLIDRIQRGVVGCLSIVTVVVVVARWIRTTAPRRRALLPSLAGAFTLTMFTILAVDGLVAGTSSRGVYWAAACSFVLVPVAFLAGLLRSRLARGGLAELLRGLGTMSVGDMETALRSALGDPSLQLVLDDAAPRRLAD